MSVSKFVTTREYRAFLLSIYDDETARTLGAPDVDGWKKDLNQKHTSVTPDIPY